MTVPKKYSKINGKFDERLDYMTGRHSKTTFFRMDVRFPKDYPHDGTNDHFTDFLKLWKEPLTKKGIETQYVWGREQDTSENPHYHVAVLVDGNRIQHVNRIVNDASKIWKGITASSKDGLIDYCSNYNGRKVSKEIWIKRPPSKKTGEELIQLAQEFESGKEDVRYRAHYLGKARSKGNVPRGVREYGASELPKPRKW